MKLTIKNVSIAESILLVSILFSGCTRESIAFESEDDLMFKIAESIEMRNLVKSQLLFDNLFMGDTTSMERVVVNDSIYYYTCSLEELLSDVERAEYSVLHKYPEYHNFNSLQKKDLMAITIASFDELQEHCGNRMKYFAMTKSLDSEYQSARALNSLGISCANLSDDGYYAYNGVSCVFVKDFMSASEAYNKCLENIHCETGGYVYVDGSAIHYKPQKLNGSTVATWTAPYSPGANPTPIAHFHFHPSNGTSLSDEDIHSLQKAHNACESMRYEIVITENNQPVWYPYTMFN